MAPRTPETKVGSRKNPGFDITCIIGSVIFDDLADMHPTTAAFSIIGEHRAPGIYSFPNVDTSGWITVTVEMSEDAVKEIEL